MSTCLFPGKFQPFHTGQLMVVKGMVQTCERVVIVVCTSDDDAMFSKEEVREMITAALLAEDILDAGISFVEDCGDDEEWMDKVLEAADRPMDEVSVWSGRDEVLALFESGGVQAKKITHVPGHEGEDIRQMIKDKNRDWMTKMPAGAIDVVHKHINGEN